MTAVLTDSGIRGLILENNRRVKAFTDLPPQEEWRGIWERHNISQQAVADYCGTTQQSVSFWARGLRQPAPHHLARLARLLEICKEEPEAA